MGFRKSLVLVAVLLLVGCGDSAPVTTSLSVLTNAQRDFDGQNVIVSGTLRTFDQPRHYWIENESFDRVALEGADDLTPWVGRTIEVRGTFLYDPAAGRRIEVELFVPSP